MSKLYPHHNKTNSDTPPVKDSVICKETLEILSNKKLFDDIIKSQKSKIISSKEADKIIGW